MIEIDVQKALSLLREAERERGHDYVYPREARGNKCLYVYPDAHGYRQPDCLVGVALKNAGVPLTALEYFGEKASGVCGASVLCESLESHGIATVTADARRIFDAAQDAQDGGQPWGDAVDRAIGYVVRKADAA